MINLTCTNYSTRLSNYIYYIDVAFRLYKDIETSYTKEVDTELMKLIDHIDNRIDYILIKGTTQFPVEYLSTGAKAAILAAHGYKVFADTMGTNAYKALLDVAREHNLDIYLHQTMLQVYDFAGTDKLTINDKVIQFDEATDVLTAIFKNMRGE